MTHTIIIINSEEICDEILLITELAKERMLAVGTSDKEAYGCYDFWLDHNKLCVVEEAKDLAKIIALREKMDLPQSWAFSDISKELSLPSNAPFR